MKVTILISSTFLLLAFIQSSCANEFIIIITPLIDYFDFNEECVINYIKRSGIGRYCRDEITNYKEMFINTVKEKLEGEESSECVINHIKFYNISEVFLKAIAYNYDPNHFVTFKNSCNDVMSNNMSIFIDDCGSRATIVILRQDNKSLRKLRHCFNDLFYKFKLDKIIVFDETDGSRSEIGARNFAKHSLTFIEEIIKITLMSCSKEKSEILKKLSNTIYDKNEEEFEEIFHENCWVDLFGFTQPSKNVERCIIDEYQASENEKLSELVLPCLKFF
ncbi:hypothetical protein PVAND_014237 [Polypedilum vanderplanki]|uniref:Uncharacterized protein n=1 Tax=Polypedilum vanderplanki TaxID=319348 RepID=A0A9J6CRR0_POLVA|nr:hypothetical protein PVAND_014237 [Polypedilum vanderplanki]